MLTVRTYVRGTGAWNMCAEHPNATSVAKNSDALTLACKWKWNYVRDNDKTKLHSEAAETGSVRWDVRVFLLTGVTSFSVDGVSVLSDREYTSELADTQSQAYQSLRQEFCSQVNTCTNWGLCDIIIKTLFYNNACMRLWFLHRWWQTCRQSRLRATCVMRHLRTSDTVKYSSQQV